MPWTLPPGDRTLSDDLHGVDGQSDLMEKTVLRKLALDDLLGRRFRLIESA